VADAVRLRRLTAADLDSVRPWFEDERTRRFLGGPRWPELALQRSQAPPREFRGRRVLGKHIWLAFAAERPVGLVTVECYTDRSAELSVVVDPLQRGLGLCRHIVQAILDLPDMEDVDEVRAAVQPENQASVRCFESAGFVAASREPDDENNLIFICRRG
jgi:L-amino acid N-acyltransferase YncA